MRNVLLKLNFLLVIMSLLFYSCTKKTSVHFHGRVVYQCNGQPFRNGNLQIIRGYDDGTYHDDVIGNGTTDNAGNYSLIIDVSQKGSFRGYVLLLENAPYNTSSAIGGSNNNVQDVLMNGVVGSFNFIKLHIKNTTPYDNYDMFDTLKSSVSFPFVLRLRGMNVDTTITLGDNSSASYFYYNYSFTKNGITSYKSDSVLELCMDTAKADLFY